MRLPLLSLVAAFAAALIAGAGAAAAEDDHPCRQVVTCDCDSIDAGLLNAAWKKDCRQCEAAIIEACEKAYPPISTAMAAGGYCETTCSVTGPDPYPRAPAKPKAGEEPPPVFTLGEMQLLCPLSMALKTVDIDGKPATGCVGKDGARQGVWFVVDEAAGPVTEIVFVDGSETGRTERPLK